MHPNSFGCGMVGAYWKDIEVKKMVEKSKNWAMVVGLLLIGAIVSAGCIGEKQLEEGKVSPSPEKAGTPTTQTPTAPLGGELLSELLGKVKGIDSVKYDVVMTSSGSPVITQNKVWEKGNKMRVETTIEGGGEGWAKVKEGVTTVAILNGDKQEKYIYCPERLEDIPIIKMDFNIASEFPIEEAVSIEGSDPTIVGSDTIDGKRCIIVKYLSSEASPKLWMIYQDTIFKRVSPAGSAKMWIWEEHGFPIRAEITTPEGTLRTNWKNIEFVVIADSMFELPAGLKIISIVEPVGGWDFSK